MSAQPAQNHEQLALSAELSEAGLELLSIEADVRAGRCTGARALARQDIRRAALDMLAEGALGSRRIAQILRVSRETVRALRRQALASGELGQAKEGLGRSLIALADAARDRIADEIDEMPRQSLPIIMGIAIDKGQLLTGGATSRAESVHAVTAEQINELVAGLPVEVIATPVDSAEVAAQKALAGPLSAVEAPASTGSGDIESPAFPACSEERAAGRAANGREDAA